MDMFDDGMPDPTTQEIPISGYPHLSARAIEATVGDLDREQAELVLRYERAHRERTPVIRMLTARLRSLRQRRAAGGARKPC